MGVNSKLLLSLVLLAVAAPLMVNGFFWKVGNAAGWSGQSGVNYTDWASLPAFLVDDDGLEFVYNPNITNVMEVTYCDYESCDATSPLAIYNTGYDEVPIKKVGHQYFISGNPADCRNGLKVDIMATNSSLIRMYRNNPESFPIHIGYFIVPGMGWPYDEGADINGATSCDSDSSAPASTPSMSPTDAAGGKAKTVTMSPNSPTSSSASKFSSSSLFLVLAAALVV